MDCSLNGYMKMHTGGIHMKMKSYAVALCVVCAMLFPSPGHTSQPGDMYLRFLEGDVQVRTEDTTEWLPASINMPLFDGDQIWVPENGRAELMLRSGAIARLDRNSYLEILTSEENRVQFYLAAGRAYTNTRLKTGDSVVFETPKVSFHAYGQSVFGIDVSENEDSTASVFQGLIYADLGTGQMKINAGDKMAFFKNAGYPQLAGITLMDQWEQWNKRRDQEFGAVLSSRATAYLPDDLGAYSSDFDKNGKWLYEREYGYVWMPTVIAAKDWSPYKVGRWVWVRGDYVWISYEPWGWAPYHYGRWAYINHRGWCWVPPARGDVYWGPGFVGWVHTPTYISWVPLAPRETYYGHGDYGLHSVNIKTVNINTVVINKMSYRNIHVNNAVTTLHHDTFVSGRPTNTAVKENLFTKERRIMGAPDIRPERSSFMPVVKQIPQANRPPQQIVNRVGETRRNNRPDHIQTQGNLSVAPTENMTRTGQTIDRKIEAPQRSNNAASKIEQSSEPKNRTVITGPQELNRERATRRLDELRSNAAPRSNIKGTIPQRGAPVGSAIVPERKIEVPEKKVEAQGKAPVISVSEQTSRSNMAAPQIPKLSENARPFPPLRSNSPETASQMQPQNKAITVPQSTKNDEKLTTRDTKPQEPREVRAPNNLPRNTIKEAVPQQAASVRAAIVPERKIEAPERKIEVLKKNPEAFTNEQKVRTEVRQQQNPKPIENIKTAPPVKSNSRMVVSQPQTPPQQQNAEKIHAPKEEQIPQQKITMEAIKSPLNMNEPVKEAGTEMRQRGR
jgi:hypothetical protein